MTSSVKPDEHSIEDILAVIRLQAAARARQDLVVAGDPTNDLAGLPSDLPKILTRNERETTASVYPFPRPTNGRLADVLRRAEAIIEADAPGHGAVGVASAGKTPDSSADQVRREMVSFFDTRIAQMSVPQQPIVTFDVIDESLPPDDKDATALPTAAPADPAAAPMELPATVLQDGAAELLRPLLKQWLTENMPRIVEKALHMEFAGKSKGEATSLHSVDQKVATAT